MKEMVHQLLREIGAGEMSSVAYDTAWVAQLGEIDRDLSNHAISWISEHQLSDGSWGTQYPFYYHDRVINTLMVMIVLAKSGRRTHDRVQVDNGLMALERITDGATQGLQADPNGATVGFEMIVPTLVEEAEKLGIIKQQADRILGKLSRLRAAKLSKIQGIKINRNLTPAFSSEMAGTDHTSILDIANLQEENGSVGNSPSATAYFASTLQKGNVQALQYLHKWMKADGGVPDVAPFDVFEPAWTIWNLQLANLLDSTAQELCKPHLDFLQKSWVPGLGIGNSANAPKDSDDSGLVYELLTSMGRSLDIEAVLHYEDADCFRCFDLEANPSISSNVHVLGALRQAGYDAKHPAVQKALGFVRRSQVLKKFWADKWHISPYYVTSHAIIICKDLDPAMCKHAVDWIVENQKPDGSWGFYNASTAEETAYALQALCVWRREHGNVSKEVIKAGVAWLRDNMDKPNLPLWIGKGLYSPEKVIRSTVLSALALGEEGA